MYNTYNYEISKHDKNYDIRETNLHKNRKQINDIKKRYRVYQKRNFTSIFSRKETTKYQALFKNSKKLTLRSIIITPSSTSRG